MRAACGASDAELVRLTQLRVDAECSGGGDDAAELGPLVAQAQMARDPVRLRLPSAAANDAG